MVIQELSLNDCLELLAGKNLVRLACSHENQPYIIPVYLVYSAETNCLFGYTTFGKKLEWMRANPQVCVELDKVSANDQWISVIITGSFQELAESDESVNNGLLGLQRPRQVHEAVTSGRSERHYRTNVTEGAENDRNQAWQVLQAYPEWWEPGWAVWGFREDQDNESYKPVFYRISIDKMTGHQATRDPGSFRNRPKG